MIIRKNQLKLKPSARPSKISPFVTAMIIPTGVGASQGGYAGDAGVYLKLIASVSDWVVTHPNICNAAGFVTLPENVLYVEGAMLDAWLRGQIALRPVHAHRIGVIFDARIPPAEQILHRNVIEACKTVYGLDILDPVLTEVPLALTCTVSPDSHASGGGLENPEVLLSATETCLKQGATAIAICGYFEGLTEHADEVTYKAASGVDPIGGLEAILSHLVTQQFDVPSAHAPVLSLQSTQPETQELLAGKVAAEFITPTFLPCVLQGLARSPQIIAPEHATVFDFVVDQLNALITPANALGGPGTLAALLQGISVIPVTSNITQMAVTSETLSAFLPEALTRSASIMPVQSYLEAVGQLQAIKLGLQLPEA